MPDALLLRKLYNEAKTEIDLLIASRNLNGYKITTEVIKWQSENWYKNAIAKRSIVNFTKNIIPLQNQYYSETPLKKWL